MCHHTKLHRVGIVIPALDEEATIGRAVRELTEAARAASESVVVVVVDNGSRDQTAARARDAGAVVVHEPTKGYGRACLRGIDELKRLSAAGGDGNGASNGASNGKSGGSGGGCDVVVFADGDGSDDPAFVTALLQPIQEKRADMVIGSRERGVWAGLVEKGALTPAQRFGNRLAGYLLAVGYQEYATDLGPFRAITMSALERLRMDDESFGWTVQMQARAAKLKLRTVEVAVAYRRRRHGKSKVSGDLKASAQAGAVILWTLARERVRPRA